jgi:hypothetical protein
MWRNSLSSVQAFDFRLLKAQHHLFYCQPAFYFQRGSTNFEIRQSFYEKPARAPHADFDAVASGVLDFQLFHAQGIGIMLLIAEISKFALRDRYRDFGGQRDTVVANIRLDEQLYFIHVLTSLNSCYNVFARLPLFYKKARIFLLTLYAIFIILVLSKRTVETAWPRPRPGQAGTKQEKVFCIRILRIVRIKNPIVESGRFGKSGYH